MHLLLHRTLLAISVVCLLPADPAAAACGAGRQELVGQIRDVFFQPGIPRTTPVTYTYKSIDASRPDCGIYARSITEGVSVRASYGSNEVHPPFSFAGVGPATSVGAEKTWSFELIYSGASTGSTHGLVEILSNSACDVCPPNYRTIGVINVYHFAAEPSTFFTVQANALNTSGSRLVLDHPLTNGRANMRFFVTPNWNPGGDAGSATHPYNNHPFSLRYDAALQRWTIQLDDNAPMSIGLAFNVRIDPSAGQVTARSGQNIFGSAMLLRHENADGNPHAILHVTPVDKGVKNPHPIAALYLGELWSVWNSDGASMPTGAAFNVKVMGYGQYTSDAGATGSNASNGVAVDISSARRTLGNYRVFDYWWANRRPNLPLIITARHRLDLGVANAHHVGVWYTSWGKHSVFNQDLASMPQTASFSIWAPPGRRLPPRPLRIAREPPAKQH